MELIIFYLVSAVALSCAVGMIVAQKPVTSAVCLVAVMFCLAVLFALLSAHLIAALQILVYAGAIMVLFLFVIMLMNLREKEGLMSAHLKKVQMAGVLALGAPLLWVMSTAKMFVGTGGDVRDMAEFGATKGVGTLLYTKYLLPFEIASILLLAALVGAVVLTKIKLR